MINNQKSKTYYDVLDISTKASSDEIRLAYMRAKTAYQDNNAALYSIMSEAECKEVLKQLEEAYFILSDPSKKRQYDQVKNINTDMDFDSRPSQSAQNPFGDSFSNSFNHSNNTSSPAIEQENSYSINGNAAVAQTGSLAQGKSITKLVAKQKFTLAYDINSEIETEIEQTTEFTGPFLKKIREYKNVDINRMAEMTKISKTYIKNIEEENFESLPAEVYVRGFVYQYAKCLKLNPDLVATSMLFRLKNHRNK